LEQEVRNGTYWAAGIFGDPKMPLRNDSRGVLRSKLVRKRFEVLSVLFFGVDARDDLTRVIAELECDLALAAGCPFVGRLLTFVDSATRFEVIVRFYNLLLFAHMENR
jgi:hypothetical protein